MASGIVPEVEQSNMMQDDKLVDEFYAYFNGQVAYPFRDHLLKSRHLETCGFRMNGIRSSCTCCVGAMTFKTADKLVDGILQPPGIPLQGKVQKTVTDITASTIFGLDNLRSMFGLSTNKAALNASFGTGENGEGNKHENVLWGTNGMVSRTLAYWKDGIVSMFDYIGDRKSVV